MGVVHCRYTRTIGLQLEFFTFAWLGAQASSLPMNVLNVLAREIPSVTVLDDKVGKLTRPKTGDCWLQYS